MAPLLMKSLIIVLLLSTYSGAFTTYAYDPSVEHASACEDSTLIIQCESGQEIRVQNANYGRLSPTVCNEIGNQPTPNLNCLSTNSYDIVSVQCNQKQSCSLIVTNGVFGDPCYGTYKYLDVDYECIPMNLSTVAIGEVIACEMLALNITCEPGNVISVLDANYGRQSPIVCNESRKMPVFNLNCLSTNSYEIVSDQCSGKQSCIVHAANSVFGEPCSGTYKYLEIDYECIPNDELCL